VLKRPVILDVLGELAERVPRSRALCAAKERHAGRLDAGYCVPFLWGQAIDEDGLIREV